MKKSFFLSIAAACAVLTAAGQRSREAVLDTPTGKIYGTLTLPETECTTAVLLIAGSGPTDRNGNNPAGITANSYAILADSLAARGIASLRYDKRGIGASAPAMTSESNIRMEHYIEDAAAWASQLASQEGFARVVLAGHSEGAIIALYAAGREKCVAGVATLAGPGYDMADLLLMQLASTPLDIQLQCTGIIASLRAGQTVPHVPQALYALFRPEVQPYLISSFRYDPAAEAARLQVPLLVIQGTADIQVGTDSADRLASAARPGTEKVIIEGMDHVLKLCTADPGDRTGLLANYTAPMRPVAGELVAALARFCDTLQPAR